MVDQLKRPRFDDGAPLGRNRARMPRKPFKLFFAFRPGAEAAAEILRIGRKLDEQLAIGGRLMLTERLHITLHVLGEYDEVPQADVIAAIRAGDSVTADAFDVVFDRAMTFPGPAAYVLRVGEGTEQLMAFWQKLGITLIPGRVFKKSAFTPHMTLSYKGRTVLEHAIEPIRWTVEELVLIKSHVGRTHHEVMGRWSLKG